MPNWLSSRSSKIHLTYPISSQEKTATASSKQWHKVWKVLLWPKTLRILPRIPRNYQRFLRLVKIWTIFPNGIRRNPTWGILEITTWNFRKIHLWGDWKWQVGVISQLAFRIWTLSLHLYWSWSKWKANFASSRVKMAWTHRKFKRKAIGWHDRHFTYRNWGRWWINLNSRIHILKQNEPSNTKSEFRKAKGKKVQIYGRDRVILWRNLIARAQAKASGVGSDLWHI